MMPIAVMLLLAWSMSDILGLLGADAYVANWVAGSMGAENLPLLIFLVACRFPLRQDPRAPSRCYSR